MLKSVFVTHKGLYQLKVLPFGLRNAPSSFQRMVNILLHGLSDFAVVYIDDLVIFSLIWEEHLVHLRTVLNRIQDAGLTIKVS